MVEMTVPSVLDPTLAPPGCHVISLFTQFTPYHIEGKEWTDQDREAYADRGMTPSRSSVPLNLIFESIDILSQIYMK